MCAVCEGRGFVQAAPLSAIPRIDPGGRGTSVAVASRNHHRRALWSKALIVPCWACGTRTEIPT